MSPSYRNPVFPEYFADPFVWRYAGRYYAIGTGRAEGTGHGEETGDPRVFTVLESEDFACWRRAGQALIRPDRALGDAFWAPEVAVADGTFYLYYSVGHDDHGHQLRVASSRSPAGPYRDLGHPLLDPASCPFAIDPHPFRDTDGRWYMFYARDFLDAEAGARPGTALVVRAMDGMTALGCEERVVLRARSDWQRFQASRSMYGSVYDWHTLEGAAVIARYGRYWCFYSGGRWESDRYGVDYAVADSVLGPYSDAGGEAGPRVLRSRPFEALGPGHCSIVFGPDGVTHYLAYHAWDPAMHARRMFLDRLRWTLAGPRCDGPTLDEQPVAA